MNTKLDTIARTIQSWLDYQEKEYAKAGKECTPDSKLICPPVWPERGVLKAWLATIKAAMSKWQPIKTAPKDGTRILVLTENGVDLAWWVKEFDTERNKRGKWVYRGAWTNGGVESWGMQENIEVHPTHWMPLPAPPAAGA